MSAIWRLPQPIISPARRWQRLPGQRSPTRRGSQTSQPSRTRRRSPTSRRNRISMYRIILFLLLIALAAAGAAWVADQPGEVALSWGGWRVHTTVPVFALAFGIAIVAAMLVFGFLRGLWRLPVQIRQHRRERRRAR